MRYFRPFESYVLFLLQKQFVKCPISTRPVEKIILAGNACHMFAKKYLDSRDSRRHNICVSSDKSGFFCLSAIFSFFEIYDFFGDKNENIKCTNCPISTHPAEKVTLACYAYLCLRTSVVVSLERTQCKQTLDSRVLDKQISSRYMIAKSIMIIGSYF